MDEVIVKIAFENLQNTIKELTTKCNDLDARLKNIENKLNNNDDNKENKRKWMFGK